MICRQIDNKINPVGNCRRPNFKVTFRKAIMITQILWGKPGNPRMERGRGGLEGGMRGRRQRGRGPSEAG